MLRRQKLGDRKSEDHCEEVRATETESGGLSISKGKNLCLEIFDYIVNTDYMPV